MKFSLRGSISTEVCKIRGFPGGSVVKNLSAKQETQVLSLGQEDSLEEEMATPSGILTWEIPWTEEPGGLQSMGSQRVGHDRAHFHFISFSWIGPWGRKGLHTAE